MQHQVNSVPQPRALFLVCSHVGWLISVLAYRLGQQKWSRYPQATVDKNATEDTPKHTIANEKFKKF